MKLFIIQLLLAAGTMVMSCNTRKNVESAPKSTSESELNDSEKDLSIDFQKVSITSQTTMAGVHSNLKGIRKYEVELSVKTSEELIFTRIFVDTVAIDIKGVMSEGDRIPENKLTKSSDRVNLTAFRHIYDMAEDAPKVHKIIEYEPSGLTLIKSAVVEYYVKDRLYFLDIPEITIKQSVYAP